MSPTSISPLLVLAKRQEHQNREATAVVKIAQSDGLIKELCRFARRREWDHSQVLRSTAQILRFKQEQWTQKRWMSAHSIFR
jgi:hypothetical protein